MKIAITGAGGFVGSHLTAELARAGHTVIGIGIGEVGESDLAGMSDYIPCDLTTEWPSVGALDAVVHLAALAAVGPSFADPQRYYLANSAPLTHLCETLLKQQTAATRILNVSTGAVYAPGTGRTETSPLAHSSPYVVSKLLGEMQASYYRRLGLDVVTVRPFNHIGPGQGAGFLLPDLVTSIEVARSTGEPMTVGDLDTRRDYTDVRDVVRAYRLLMEADTRAHEPVNVCSGTTLSGREVLSAVLEAMPGERPDITVDASRIRRHDPREISGDSSWLKELTGWEPSLSITETVHDFLAAR